MKVYRGIVKGNTILLEEKPDLPDECPALVEIKPIDEARDREIARRHIALLKKAPRVGKSLYKKREELYEGRKRGQAAFVHKRKDEKGLWCSGAGGID
ncbi:MAG: hypothetical protein WD688_22590 [Candidatus Binatia bacterium]